MQFVFHFLSGNFFDKIYLLLIHSKTYELISMTGSQPILSLMKATGKDAVKQDGKCVISTGMETAGKECTLKGI